jgi:pimeloyl-ACP methyl ester carboxylesterase
MQRPAGKLTVILVTWVVCACLPGPVSAQIPFGPCPDTNDLACGRLAVALDPSGQTPGWIDLAIRRHRSPVGNARTAVIALAGGPGQAANPFTPDFLTELGGIVSSRDLIVLDQRGTGNSDPLKCQALESTGQEEPSGRAVAACAAQIGPTRRFFTTADSVADIEAIRQAGGYEKLILYGTSYGTKVAELYAQAHPEYVEGLILDSVVPPSGPNQFLHSTLAAIPRILSQLCSRHACAHITSHPYEDFSRLVKRMHGKPLRGKVIDGRGAAHAISIYPEDLLEVLLAGDFAKTLRADFPGAIRSALDGDTAPLALLDQRTHDSGEGSDGIDEPLFLDTTCEEGAFPWNRTSTPTDRLKQARARVNRLSPRSYAPFSPGELIEATSIPECAFWPYTTAAPVAEKAPLPNVPTLILSGADDLRTPTSNAREVATQIPDAHLLVVPNVGHSVLGTDPSSCSLDALKALFSGHPVKPCSPFPVASVFRPTPLAPRALSTVHSAKGYGGRPGRTLEAVLLTLRYANRNFELDAAELGSVEQNISSGGLRGGWMSDTDGSIAFHHYTYIPGVTVSGTIATGEATLAIGGAAASHGRLHLGPDQGISGTLGGLRVRLKHASISTDTAAQTSRWQTSIR